MKIALILTTGAALTLAGAAAAGQPSWVFLPSTYTHDPATGARVAQYQRVAPVEGLPDPRLVTSGYRANRTTLRGANGSFDNSIVVTNFANGRGGLDAEWERVADEWRASFLSGGFFQQGPGFAAPGFAPSPFGQPGFVQPGFVQPGFVQPGFVQPGFAPGFFPPGFVAPPGFGFQPGFNDPRFRRPRRSPRDTGSGTRGP